MKPTELVLVVVVTAAAAAVVLVLSNFSVADRITTKNQRIVDFDGTGVAACTTENEKSK